MQIRDRIKQLRRVSAKQLRPNPKNWRTHPQQQSDALKGVLAEIGYASALLVRECEDGTLQLIDGHLRAETTPDAVVPVLVLDVTEEEAEKILLTHDPLTGLAGADEQKLADLIATTDLESPELARMLNHLEEEFSKQDWPFDELERRPEVEIPESFQVVIECEDENDQEALYDRMRKEGYRCRVLTL